MIELSTDGPIETPKDAATIVVYRRTPSIEIFMVKRHARSRFMANAMVFPGGRLEADDCHERWDSHVDVSPSEAAQIMHQDDPALARGLMVAAVRETFEEAGLLLTTSQGRISETQIASFAKARDQLNDGKRSFVDLVADLDIVLSLKALRFVAHWITPAIEKRRFDARFFAIEAPDGQLGAHDQRETTASAWLSPTDALNRYQEGTIELAPPTLRILLECARKPNWLAKTHHDRPMPIQPQLHSENGCLHLLLPGDPKFDPPGVAANRVSLVEGRWVSTGRGA